MSDQLSYFFSELMGLKAPYSISEIKQTGNEVQIKIEITPSYRPSNFHQIQGYKSRRWRHLDIMQCECYIECKVPVYKNTRSNKFEMLEVPWSIKGSGFTLLFEQRVLGLLKLTACKKSVAEYFNLYPQRIETIYNRHTLAAYQSRDITLSSAIGLDETSTKKGHEYITVFWDMHSDKLLDIREGRSSEVIKEYVEELEITGNKPSEKIKEIVCDMSGAFAKGIKENLPQSKVTFDRFHVVQLVNRYMYPLKKSKNINKEKLYDHLSEFDLVWEQKSELDAAGFLTYWMDRSIELFKLTRLVKSLNKHFSGIISYCRTSLTNGKLEGINNKIQWIKRAARGYRSKENFMRMIHFVFGSLKPIDQTIS